MYLGGPATVGAGPLMCADSWAVTLWRIASAARLRRSRGHRTERGQPVLSARHHCGCSLGQVGVRPVPGCSRPGRRRCPNWSAPHASVTAPAHRTHWPAARPCSPLHPASGLLTSGRSSQTRMRARAAGSRDHHDQRSRYATSRSLAPFSRLHDHDRLTRAASPSRFVFGLV